MSTMFNGKKGLKVRPCCCRIERSKSSPDLITQSSVIFGESVEDDEDVDKVLICDDKSENTDCFNAVCQTEISLGRENEGVLIEDGSEEEIHEETYSLSHFNLNAETKIWRENVERQSSNEILSNGDEAILSSEPSKLDLENSEIKYSASSEINRINQKLMDYELHKARKFSNLNQENTPSISNLSSDAYMIESTTPSEFSPPDLLPSEPTIPNRPNVSESQSEVELKVINLENCSSQESSLTKIEIPDKKKSSTKISISNQDSKIQIVQNVDQTIDLSPKQITLVTTRNDTDLKPKPTKLKIRIGDSKIKICTNESISMKGMTSCQKFVIPAIGNGARKAIVSTGENLGCDKIVDGVPPKSYTKVQICTAKKSINISGQSGSSKDRNENPYKILCQVSPSKSMANIQSNRRTKICIIPTETTINLMPTLVSTTCQTELPIKEIPSQRMMTTVENTLSTYENEIQPLRDALSALQSKIRSLHITDFQPLNYHKSGLINYSNPISPPVSLPKTLSYSNLNTPSCGCHFHDKPTPIRRNQAYPNHFNNNLSHMYHPEDKRNQKINDMDYTSHRSHTMVLPSRRSKCKNNDRPGFVPVKTDPSDFFDRPNILF